MFVVSFVLGLSATRAQSAGTSPAAPSPVPFEEPLTFAPGQVLSCAIAPDPSMGYQFTGLADNKVRLNTIIHNVVDPDSKSVVLENRPSGADDMIYLADDHEYPGLDIVSRIEVIVFKRSAAEDPLQGLIKLSELYLATEPDGSRIVTGGATNANYPLVDCRIQ